MTATIAPPHAKSLNAVSPRKLWLAAAGDLVITPRPIEAHYKEYVCSTLGLGLDDVKHLTPYGDSLTYLAESIAEDSFALSVVNDFAQKNPDSEALVFAQDRPTLEFFADAGIRLSEYDTAPTADLLDLIYSLNTKSGFRDVAASLGFQVVPGARCDGINELCQTLPSVLQATGRAIVKFDRSSNGYGNTVLTSETSSLRDLKKAFARFGEQPPIFLVESYLPFVSTPSVEFVVHRNGPQFLYTCGQRCENNAWIGMITPPVDLSAPIIDELHRIGSVFGEYVFAEGYRGVFDIDCGVTESGAIYVTETNFRRTGGTYLDAIVRRLVGEEYSRDYSWIADVRRGRTDISWEEATAHVARHNLAFDASSGCGVLLPTNTVMLDGKWRYLVIDNDISRLTDTEKALTSLLGLI